MNHSVTASLIGNHAKNFDCSSEAVCRTILDFILNECLAVHVSLMSLLFVILAMNLQYLRKATMLIVQLRRPVTVNRKPLPLVTMSEYMVKSPLIMKYVLDWPLQAELQLQVI